MMKGSLAPSEHRLPASTRISPGSPSKGFEVRESPMGDRRARWSGTRPCPALRAILGGLLVPIGGAPLRAQGRSMPGGEDPGGAGLPRLTGDPARSSAIPVG